MKTVGGESAGRGGDRPLPSETDVGAKASRPGPPWRAWAITIVAAVLLSLAATILLCGTAPFRLSGGAGAGGCGGACCPPAGK